ncbi:MAG: TrpR protein [Candidatus Beckwithbacteria bacterium GW2011_GWB1_47_15]|uniref:TrpR protein n=1 Tax=Candidatus Beckwithbacteria bacterium GW2011_GWB1_47_15 TaxID=1618371 RepID=A0A0G1URZ8_9BACT|nr:MAG: TrpR protein [Candidatus Beckwithbacteria bacterium GW2011_GWB1_47_15]
MDKINLNKDQKLVVDSFYKVRTKKGLNSFIEDLFSPEETLDLAQRLKIAKLILDGKTYEEIAAEIPVSTSTISKIGQVIKFGKGGFILIKNMINLEFQIYHLLTGLAGGLVRGLVGIMKQTQKPDEFKIHWKYFGLTMLVSGVVGVVSGIIADGDWRISLLAGYAGTDFLESLYRLRFPQMFSIAQTVKTVTEESNTGKVTTQTTTPVTAPVVTK